MDCAGSEPVVTGLRPTGWFHSSTEKQLLFIEFPTALSALGSRRQVALLASDCGKHSDKITHRHLFIQVGISLPAGGMKAVSIPDRDRLTES